VSINFTEQSVDAVFDNQGAYLDGCVLEHAVVEYAGAGGATGAITALHSGPYIRGCSIRGNATAGVSADSSPGDTPIRIEGTEIMDNADGGIYIGGELGGHIIRGNFIARNTSTRGTGGVLIWGVPEHFAETGVTVCDNTIQDNQSVFGGLSIRDSSNAVVCRNRITGNQPMGLNMYEVRVATVSSNHIVGNHGVGISATGGGSYVVFSRNVIRSNEGGGILAEGLYSSVLRENLIIGNQSPFQGAGVSFQGGSDITMTGSIIANNISTRSEPGDVGCPHGAGGIYASASGLLLSVDGEPPNALIGNSGYDVFNDNVFSGSALDDIDARNVWWGTRDIARIQERICDCFDDLTRACVLPAPWMQTGLFDFDGNGSIQTGDSSGFVPCISASGPGVPAPEGNCAKGDTDADGDIDLFDFALFQTLIHAP
jgi:hypothetical protein